MGFDTKNYFSLSSQQKKFFKYFNIFLILVLLPLSLFLYFNYAINRPAQNFKEINFNLKNGSSLEAVASDLKLLEIINSESLFILYVKIQREYPNFKAGIYTFKSGSSIKQIVTQIRNGSNGVAITFTEGKRIEEYGIQASEKLPSFNFEKYLEKTKGLEGLLFPDTYFFYSSATEDDVIRVMKNNFQSKIAKSRELEGFKKINLTDSEIYIVASLLEKESFRSDEKRIIAGIIIKRLKKGEILGIDASNQYGIASKKISCQNDSKKVCLNLETAKKIRWWDPNITLKDLQQDSPFNLRLNTGLPPQPIASFSFDSLVAVIENQPSIYNYYIHDKNGVVHFASTLAEHNANVSIYLSR